jgi:hypothetical protein
MAELNWKTNADVNIPVMALASTSIQFDHGMMADTLIGLETRWML